VKALRLVDWKHGPEFEDVADPDPGLGAVRVRIGGAGACHSDLHLMYDFEPGLLPWGPPFTLGHENAGWVDALGPGAHRIEVGEPVAVYGPWGCGVCPRCVQGMENYCVAQAEMGVAGGGLGADGGMAKYMVVPNERYLVPLGDLDPADAAPLTDAGLTPYHAIKRSLPRLVPGSTAVVIGVGGLGHMGVQILRALSPARVVAVDRDPEALALAIEVGAHDSVSIGPDATREIRDITRGVGADLVVDFVGVDETLALGAAVGRPLGDLALVGIGGGVLPVGFFTMPYELSVATTYWGSIPELVEVIALARAGGIRARVQRFSLDDAPRAYEQMRAGKLRGRAVIVPA
jgi:alcohol dehydrogenase, propanol-preferring